MQIYVYESDSSGDVENDVNVVVNSWKSVCIEDVTCIREVLANNRHNQ